MSRSVAAEAAKETDRDRPINKTRSRFLSFIVISYFAVVFSLICISSFLQKSPTIDEPMHLVAGYSYLKWKDFRANPEHPPFAKAWAALPLLAFDIKDPLPSSPQWDFIPEDGRATWDLATDVLFAYNDGETLFFYAKLQMIALALLLAFFVYRWSRELFGAEAAIAALFIFVLDPNILAHSQIVHTDLPFTTFFFIGTYFYWRVLRRLTWFNLIFTSLFFALAAITKYSYVAVLMAWALLGTAAIFSSKPHPCGIGTPRSISQRWREAVVLIGVGASAAMTAYLFIWAVYAFRFDAIPGGLHPLHMELVMPPEISPLRRLAAFTIDHRVFPEAWIYGQLYAFKNLERVAYLMGQLSIDGFWSYFPVAFAVKTPLPTIILLFTGLGMLIRKRLDRAAGLFLVIPVVVFFSLAVWSRMNIGVRHILPIYPFLFVLAAATARELWKGKTWIKAGVGFLVIWYLWSCVSTYPHYLAFFNELAGGPRNGYKVLLDSNLDWGQDLKGLKRWMDANGVKNIRFLYFGAADPEYYGIDASYVEGSLITYVPPATRTTEAPLYVAMSAHLLYGVRREDEFVRPFRSREPVATIGHSIFIFKLDESGSP